MNYIICELDIKEDVQIIRNINSYEESNREDKFLFYEKEYENENENEIKENCIIFINDEFIPFSYFHKFNKKENLYYLNNLYLNESIYLINNTKDKDIFVSYGKLLYENNADNI